MAEIRTPVLCPKCEHEMPRITHATKDVFQCVNNDCDYRRWHTKDGNLAFPRQNEKSP